MGFGGITALGCTIGQGVSALSTLALGAFLSFAAIIAGLESQFHWPARALIIALVLIIIGTVYTTARRTRRIIRNLER